MLKHGPQSLLEVTDELEEEIFKTIATDDAEKFNSLLEQGLFLGHNFNGSWIGDILSNNPESINFYHWTVPEVIALKNALKIADNVFSLQHVQALFPYTAAVAQAALLGKADMIRLMISKGFDPNKKRHTEPPLLIAVISGNYECCEALVGSGLCNPYVKDRYGRIGKDDRPLGEAARQGRLDIVKLIVEFKKDKKTLVRAAVLAAENGHEEIAQYLLDSLDAGRKKGSTQEYPYHMAIPAVKHRMVSVIERLLRIEPRILDLVDNNRTMLSTACEHNHIDLVEYFIGLGADVHATDSSKYIVYSGKGFAFCASEELFEACNLPPTGAGDMKISLPLYSQTPSSPLAEAAANGHLEIVKMLVGRGVKLDTAYIKSPRFGIDRELTYDAPAINLARAYGHEAVVEYLSTVS
ncbi:ankyrin repeat domain-containing protein [Pseudomonas argentinensis]|uniref:ankyrin repeat domain-containing protein n=1 Tax=Phytopseudomonas argentinensis TaxID=289370 RepID=UPI00147A1713|nr:ankyrin repeat domain-containing protein [Pseudomonas argentinensis]